MVYRILISITLLFCLQLNGQGKFQDTIPFKTYLGLITIPITFNGIEKQFMFDTGATHSVGLSWVKNELKPTRKAVNVTSSGSNRSKLRYYKSGKIKLASAKINKHRILGTSDNEIFSCYNIDGVLGMDIISAFNWIIDFKEKYLIMYEKSVIPKSTENMYPITVQYKRSPYLILTMEGDRSIPFLLDTGATSSDINDKVSLGDTDVNPGDHKVYSGSYDFNGKLNMGAINVLKRTFKSKKVLINGVFDYGTQSSKIGNRLWTNKRLFLSKKQNMFLVSNPQLNEFRTKYDCSFIMHQKEIVVGHIVVGSDAWKKGLRQGTEIKAINGKTFSGFCELTQYQLSLAEEDKTMEVTLMDNSQLKLVRKQHFEE